MNEDLYEFFTNHVSLYNYLFPESPYEVIGFSDKKDDTFRVVVKQPFIQGDVVLNQLRSKFDSSQLEEKVLEIKQEIRKDISERIGKLDPRYSRSNECVNSEYIIEDLHLRNVMTTKEGNFIYIDVITSLNTKEDYTFGSREYHNFNIV